MKGLENQFRLTLGLSRCVIMQISFVILEDCGLKISFLYYEPEILS